MANLAPTVHAIDADDRTVLSTQLDMWLVLAALLLFEVSCFVVPAHAEARNFTAFSEEADAVPFPWQVIKVSEKEPATKYSVKQWDGLLAIEAIADKSMAILARPVNVDLHQTPVLCWRWRIDAPLVNADMRKKSGDDYAARVYVAFSLPADSVGWLEQRQLALARMI